MTGATPKTLLKIRESYPSFHGNYARIADCILRNPGLLVGGRLSDIAAACGCDNAQIIRFCRKLGFKGFSDMRRSISHDLIPLQTRVDSDSVRKKSGFERLLEDFRGDYLQTVNDTVSVCGEKAFLKTVEAIRKARRIMLCGMGASGIVCEDLRMKLVHMGYPAFYHSDPAMNKMMSFLMEKRDLLIAVSFRGENADVMSCVKTAKDNGCPVAAITNYPNSPLARQSDTVLLTSSREDDFRIGAMTSRLSQLMIVDILSVMLALDDMNKTERNLAGMHAMLNETEGVK